MANIKEEIVDWPLWYPGKSLSAVDLIGLENFLFSRFNYPEKGYGIISLEEDHIIASSSEDGEKITIEVKDIKGITKRGHYVQIGREGKRISLDIVEGYNYIDLVIQINKREQEDEKKVKYFTFANFVQGKDKYIHHEDCLYLGRYKCTINITKSNRNNIDFVLEKYPPVYSLFSISPQSMRWTKWVEPLVEKINKVLESLKQRKVSSFSHHQVVALVKTYDIAYQLFRAPVSVLVYKLGYLNWLLNLLKNSQSNIDVGEILKKNEIDFENEVSNLPLRLSEMLDNTTYIEPNKNILQNKLQYSFEWKDNSGDLIIVFHEQHLKPCDFQIQLDFTKTHNKNPDCEEVIRTRLEDEFENRIIGREVNKTQGEQKEVVCYEINVRQEIREKAKLILYALSHREPEITIKKNELQ